MEFRDRIEQMEESWREELKQMPENSLELQQELKERYRTLFALEQSGDEWINLFNMHEQEKISDETYLRASQVILGS